MIARRLMTDEKALQEKVLKYWKNLSKEDLRRGREGLLRDMAKKLDMPKELAEKFIGEWEAGKNL